MSSMDSFPEIEKRWFMHVGYLAQNWAAIETVLDNIVRQLHVHYDGQRIEPSPPQSFKRKRTFIRKVFAGHPALNEHSESLAELLETATRLAAIRHWALHSGWAETNMDDALLGRYKASDPLRWEQQRFSLEEIFQAAVESAKLAFVLTLFSQRAFSIKPPDEIDRLLDGLDTQIEAAVVRRDPTG